MFHATAGTDRTLITIIPCRYAITQGPAVSLLRTEGLLQFPHASPTTLVFPEATRPSEAAQTSQGQHSQYGVRSLLMSSTASVRRLRCSWFFTSSQLHRFDEKIGVTLTLRFRRGT